MKAENPTIENVLAALSLIRCGAADSEEMLHMQAAAALSAAGFEAQHEARLGPRCRIDFLCGDIGIEIKKKRPERAKLIAQLTRYAACEQVSQLVVIAPRGVNMPQSVAGKKVTMLSLEKLWGICLP